MTVTIESHQSGPIEFLAKRRRALVKSPAGSGKTIIAAAALDRVIRAKPRDRKVRLGWMANTIEQCQQAKAALEKFGLFKHVEATIECPAGMPPVRDFDVLVIDEAHHVAARTWLEVANAHAGCLWLFSATPFGEDTERNQIVRDLCQGNIYTVKRDDIKGRVVAGKVVMLDDTDDPDVLRPLITAEIDEQLEKMAKRILVFRRWEIWGKLYFKFCEEHGIQWEEEPGMSHSQAAWEAMKETHLEQAEAAMIATMRDFLWPRVAFRVCQTLGIATNERRNAKIIEIANWHSSGGDTGSDAVLILVNTVAHGQWLAKNIRGAVVCHSKMGARLRSKAIADFRSGEVWCLIATSLADEGLDVPRANVLVMAGAGRSSGKVEQRAGRVLRAFEEKTHGTIYDFTDPQYPLLFNQSRKRQAVYRTLGYTVTMPQKAQAEFF